MKRKIKLWSGYLGMVILLASCAPAAHVEKDDNVDFSNYKTFSWIDKDGKNDLKLNKKNELTEQKIRNAVSKELEKQGWRESKKNPDVLISYDVLVERSVKEQTNARYTEPFVRTFYNPHSRRFFNVYYPSRFIGYENNSVSAREGTITISMIDANTEKTIWQGWTTDEVNSKNLTSKEIQNSIKSIFRKFDIVKN